MKKKLLLATALLFLTVLSWAQPAITPNKTPAYLAFRQEGRLPMISAHRGGRFIPGYPENALETFGLTLRQAPAMIECDISMSRDSVLFLLHDNTLDRTTNGHGRADSTDWATIQGLYLYDDFGHATPYRIPRLEDALLWCKHNAALFTLDVKRGVPFPMVAAAVDAAGVADNTIMITYNLEDALEVHRLAPHAIISVNIRNEQELDNYLASGIPPGQLIAFTGLQQRSMEFYKKLHDKGIPAIIGTMGNLDTKAMVRGPQTYLSLFRAGADIFATDRPLDVYQAVNGLQ
ncbi:MAG: glycerophosphodiester phosphodiesterase family protein [Phaeodactylibacter sp.]|nr:glycerophosphodiester phosphodiesterase family protein [Phaeodactylibacter sp.]MCB9277138.1 glycerophosphodiester phosphodiesterase family protein [Lewinellaceae bacterium]